MLHSPANAVYEILIGLGCLGTLLSIAISLPFVYAMIATDKEERERLS